MEGESEAPLKWQEGSREAEHGAEEGGPTALQTEEEGRMLLGAGRARMGRDRPAGPDTRALTCLS